MRRVLVLAIVSLTGVLLTARPAASQQTARPGLGEVLDRAAERVQAYFERARSLMAREVVLIHSMRQDLNPIGRARQLEYDVRLDWEPGAADGAQVSRELRRVNGRPPRPADEQACLDLRTLAGEPLTMLLPEQQPDYAFAFDDERPADGTIVLTYRDIRAGAVDVTWRGDCVSVSLPGHTSGRLWLDGSTFDVLRFDERLDGQFEVEEPRERARGRRAARMVVERADTSIRYRRVRFTDPDEVVLLPASIESLTVVRGSGAPVVHRSQELSDYRRFLAEGRIVE
ncbi:MAG: hypothetical protein HOP14_00175 [Acidobacteria bacterium]|nr:hypothetical protein [Acidobacteriota bacterium]